jgi:hypothetical protein
MQNPQSKNKNILLEKKQKKTMKWGGGEDRGETGYWGKRRM